MCDLRNNCSKECQMFIQQEGCIGKDHTKQNCYIAFMQDFLKMLGCWVLMHVINHQ